MPDSPSAPLAGRSTASGLRSDKTAMLVIHGIGEQNPYETLDSFARGVFTFLRRSCGLGVALAPEKTAHKDWTEVAMRIKVASTGTDKPAGYVDIYEYYWAPYTEDKISWLQTLKWLIQTDLTPLRYLANNLQELLAVTQSRSLLRSLGLFWREVRRIVVLYLPLAALVVYLLSWLARAPSLTKVFQPLALALRGEPWWARPAVLASYLVALLMAIFTLQGIWRLAKRRGKSIQRSAELGWLASAIVAAVFFYWLGCEIAEWRGVSLASAWQVVRNPSTLKILGAALIAAALRYVLMKYVGDVAVYVSADAKSKSYEARSAILKGSTKALAEILADDRYERVILAGHSLGSVIAYDTINELLTQVSATPGGAEDRPAPLLTLDQLKKLRGLVTFGSPLDKIYYFFRQKVKEDQAIRAQILSMLHSFRKLPSGRDYGAFKFEYQLPRLEGLLWLNAWSPLDPVSAKLHFYGVDDQKWFFYSVPGLAHLGYWGDPKFFSFLGRLLVQ